MPEFNRTLERIRLAQEIVRRKYYEGFGVGKEKKMFQEELKDVENIYEKTVEEAESQIESQMPYLLYRMEQFILLHKKKEMLQEKLDTLRLKQGRKEEGDEDE